MAAAAHNPAPMARPDGRATVGRSLNELAIAADEEARPISYRPGCPVSARASRASAMGPAGPWPGGALPGPGHDAAIRASDRDREHAVRLLRDAHAEGRLDLDDLMERTGAAFAATAWGELAALTADLPADQRFVPAGTGDGRPDFRQARCGPPHPFAALWPVAVIWLAVAAAAHVAAAIPLILLAVFVLRAACWRVPPEGRPGGSLARCGSRRPAPRGGIPGSHRSAVTAAWNDDGSGD